MGVGGAIVIGGDLVHRFTYPCSVGFVVLIVLHCSPSDGFLSKRLLKEKDSVKVYQCEFRRETARVFDPSSPVVALAAIQRWGETLSSWLPQGDWVFYEGLLRCFLGGISIGSFLQLDD